MPTINDCESSESSAGSPTIITCTTPEMKFLHQLESGNDSPVGILNKMRLSPQARSPSNNMNIVPNGTNSLSSNNQNSQRLSPTPPMNLPYKVLPPIDRFGVSSPPGPRCYDIIEEELMFPLDETVSFTYPSTPSNISSFLPIFYI